MYHHLEKIPHAMADSIHLTCRSIASMFHCAVPCQRLPPSSNLTQTRLVGAPGAMLSIVFRAGRGPLSYPVKPSETWLIPPESSQALCLTQIGHTYVACTQTAVRTPHSHKRDVRWPPDWGFMDPCCNHNHLFVYTKWSRASPSVHIRSLACAVLEDLN